MSNVPMTLPELALAIHETTFFHSSTFAVLEDGRIIHAAGTRYNFSNDGGISWSETEKMVDTDGNPVGGSETSLVKLSGTNSVGLAARFNAEPEKSAYAMPRVDYHFKYWRSDDAGKTWTPPVRMTAPGTNTAGYQDSFLRASNGRILLPVFVIMGQRSAPNDNPGPMTGRLVNNQWVSTAGHFYDPGFSSVYILYSDDEGATWKRNSNGELIYMVDPNCYFAYGNESSMTEVAPNVLLVMMRCGLGRLIQAWSYDNGETWTRPQATALASSTCPPQIRTLPKGHLLCVWNQESEAEIKQGYNRTRISSAVSRNGGSVWEFYQNVQSIHETTRVEPGPIRPVRPEEGSFAPGKPAPERDARYITHEGPMGRWSYPSVLVMKDRVLIAHTYRTYEPHPDKAEILMKSGKKENSNQLLKVLPMKWFYGGKEPADNPFLPRAYEPAQP